jgi:hypothetical protein
MGVRVYTTGQNKEAGCVDDAMARGIDIDAHLTDDTAFNQDIRLLSTFRGNNCAILNQGSHILTPNRSTL